MNFNGSPSLKNRFPFRLGTTSYIIPADLMENVEFLADKVDDIELVLFESDEISNLPDASTIKALKETADRHDLTYTVHLPLDTWLGHREEPVRESSVDKCLRVIERTAALDPFAYILHFHGDEKGKIPSADMGRWIDGHRRSVERLIRDVPPGNVCVEMLDYPYELIEGIVGDYGLSTCLDMGHLLYYGHSPEEHLDRYLRQTRVLHIHGIEEGQDHRSLAVLPAPVLAAVMDRLGDGEKNSRVLTMEIFDEKAFNESLDVLSRFA
jgi:sugar phosphate isomerase/epimerase